MTYNLQEFKIWLNKPENNKYKTFHGSNILRKEPPEGIPIDWDAIINDEIENDGLEKYLEKKSLWYSFWGFIFVKNDSR